MFVDAIFTNFSDARFTKAFDVIARKCAGTCLWRACIAD